jgi:uncharacterized membrane protein
MIVAGAAPAPDNDRGPIAPLRRARTMNPGPEAKRPVEPPSIAPAPPRRRRLIARLRNHFLTGLVIVGPVTLTIYLTLWFVGWADSWVKPFIPKRYSPDAYLPFTLPGFGMIVAIVFITLLGALTANLVGRSVVGYGESLLARMPFVRTVYRALKQIFETVLAERGQSFQKVALLEFPRRGAWAIVFVTAEARGEIAAKMAGGDDMVAIFMPSTPNPTTGYLVYVPRSDLVMLDMTVEEAAKLVISAGLVTPEYPGVAAISDKAREADAVREAEETPDGALQPAPSRRTA